MKQSEEVLNKMIYLTLLKVQEWLLEIKQREEDRINFFLCLIFRACFWSCKFKGQIDISDRIFKMFYNELFNLPKSHKHDKFFNHDTNINNNDNALWQNYHKSFEDYQIVLNEKIKAIDYLIDKYKKYDKKDIIIHFISINSKCIS
jgi:hypothetical protein